MLPVLRSRPEVWGLPASLFSYARMVGGWVLAFAGACALWVMIGHHAQTVFEDAIMVAIPLTSFCREMELSRNQPTS